MCNVDAIYCSYTVHTRPKYTGWFHVSNTATMRPMRFKLRSKTFSKSALPVIDFSSKIRCWLFTKKHIKKNLTGVVRPRPRKTIANSGESKFMKLSRTLIILNHCPEAHRQEQLLEMNLPGTSPKHSSPASNSIATSMTWSEFVPCVHQGQSNLPGRSQVYHLEGKGCLHLTDQPIPKKLSSSPWRLDHLNITGRFFSLELVTKCRRNQEIRSTFFWT